MTTREMRTSVINDMDYLMADEYFMRRLERFANRLRREMSKSANVKRGKAIRKSGAMADGQLDSYFLGKPACGLSDEGSSLTEIVGQTRGRIIKPVEKWL